MGYLIGYGLLAYVLFAVAMVIAMPEWFLQKSSEVMDDQIKDRSQVASLFGFIGIFIIMGLICLVPVMFLVWLIAETIGPLQVTLIVLTTLGTVGVSCWYRFAKNKEKEQREV